MLGGGTGNKKDNITVIYTPWSNLKKDGSMAAGQVGFKDQKKVRLPSYGDTPKLRRGNVLQSNVF